MFHSPYDTAACLATVGLPAIQSALQRAFVHGDLKPAVMLKGQTLKGVYIVPPYVKDIKLFSMPLTFETSQGETLVAVDVRGSTKATSDSSMKIVDGGQYEGALLRGGLTYLWINGGAADMRRWNDIAARVFIRLLCETIVRQLNLNSADQQAIYVTCGYFYFVNFIDYNEIAENPAKLQDEKDRITVTVSRMTRISPQRVADLMDKATTIPSSLDKFCDTLREVVENPRLERLSGAMIMTLMGGFWYGGEARRLMATALEYPPVWLSLIYQALLDRNYHGSQLSKMVESENRNNAGTQFIREMSSFLEIINDD